jgi:hypothetical protein
MSTDQAEAAEKAGGEEKDGVIVVNAQEHAVESLIVTYDEVVALAYPTPPAPDTRYTVTYRKAKEPHHEGSLAPGQSVEVKKKGTIFNVTPTSKS